MMRGRGMRWRQRGCSRRTARLMEPALLLLLHHGPAHGYTLSEQLGEFGLADLHPSAIYRALRDMEERGWVGSTWDDEESQGPPRRVYQLTELGDEVLRWWAEDLGATRGMIDHLLSVYSHHMSEEQDEHHTVPQQPREDHG
jgi:PadR family transcriptional regulator PadR